MTQRFEHTISKIDHATSASDLRNSPTSWRSYPPVDNNINVIFRMLALISILVFSNGVKACTYISEVTWYYGKEQQINGYDVGYYYDFEFDEDVANDIKRTKTITFEGEQPIHDHHLFYLRDGMLYVKGIATEFVDGSFRYLGNGYFRLYGYIYYRGKREAAYSGGAVVKTWTETRKDPPPPRDPDGPPPIIGCPDFPHLIFVLETSDGLHLEHEESYGFGKFPRGETCKSATGHTCAEFHRMQGDKKKRF